MAKKAKTQKSNMYASTKTWNPFKGCYFGCTYCEASFKRQAKRQMHNCTDCYDYVPHCHEERLRIIPHGDIVFACGNSDVAFCPPAYFREILWAIKDHTTRYEVRQEEFLAAHEPFYFQSKRPSYFAPFLVELPTHAVLLTTLETNRDEGYETISTAPWPSERYLQFKSLDYHRKAVTIEPVMDFDLDIFFEWIRNLAPGHVWIGFNTKPKSVKLPEPSMEKVAEFIAMLVDAGIEVRGKDLRGLEIPTTRRSKRRGGEGDGDDRTVKAAAVNEQAALVAADQQE